MKKKKKPVKLIIFILLVFLILFLNRHFGWSAYLSEENNLAFLKQMVRDNFFMAACIYITVTIAGCVILALPGISFAVLASIIFGPVIGTLLCSVATTAGAAAAFLAGRFFLKDSIKPMAGKNKHLKKLLFDQSDKKAILILMITRLVPLFPYNLQNFAYGITDIRFSTYTVCSFVFMFPGTALFTVGTAGILAGEKERTVYILAALVLAVLVFGIGYILKKKYIGAGENSE